MELHSYAKRRASKKWTIEQKRKLVEARIKYDPIFSSKPTMSVAPWKIILNLAKLDDFNVFFVRKQWSNMVAKYKLYKQSRLGNVPSKAIDDDMIQKITQEWEFFEPIHIHMTRKTANLHSYALTTQEVPLLPEQPTQDVAATTDVTTTATLHSTSSNQLKQNQESNSSTERVNIFSSDTNEDALAANIKQEFPTTLNTDHDFYSKKSPQQLNYFADASEDTQESLVVDPNMVFQVQEVAHTQEVVMESLPIPNTFIEEMQQPPQSMDKSYLEHVIKTEPQMEVEAVEVPPAQTGAQPSASTREKPKLSERDKYYRHKRRFNRRLEQRFDAILNVFGQVVKSEYPNIDLSPLISNLAATSTAVVNKLFSSDEEFEDDVESAEEFLTETESSNRTDAKQE